MSYFGQGVGVVAHGVDVDTSAPESINSVDGALNTFSSATSAGAVTPSDSTVLDFNALYVGGTGNVIVTVGGSDVTFSAVPVGTILPVRGTKVKLATTATLIVWMKW